MSTRYCGDIGFLLDFHRNVGFHRNVERLRIDFEVTSLYDFIIFVKLWRCCGDNIEKCKTSCYSNTIFQCQ